MDFHLSKFNDKNTQFLFEKLKSKNNSTIVRVIKFVLSDPEQKINEETTKFVLNHTFNFLQIN